jgi:hypothetical protein
MNVVLISPGYPAEMPHFTRGLAEVGARVIGVGDQPRAALDPELKRHLADYLHVRDLWNEEATVRAIHEHVRGRQIDRVECLWEPGMILAARARAALGVPGMSVEETLPFRDKVVMKDVLVKAGVRTSKHRRGRSVAEVRAAAEEIGFPLIVKPVAGAGSADTYAIREQAELERALSALRGVDEVTVEEFIEGEEHTWDTVCAEGEILFENVAWYRPTPLVAKQNEWISAQSTCLRDIDRPEVRIGRELGRQVLAALGWRTGFTHMEWFRTRQGEAVFGEIGGRPPGARLVHVMNYSCDADLFRGWAEAVCHGRIGQDLRKKYNAGVVFKRAIGQGIVRAYEGLDRLMARYGEHVCVVDLVPIGSPRRDWRSSAIGDGWVVVRHPDLQACLQMGDAFAAELRLIAS